VDAERARARRVAWARAVLILAVLAAAALLLLIVVGSLTSDTTDETAQPTTGHIGLTVFASAELPICTTWSVGGGVRDNAPLDALLETHISGALCDVGARSAHYIISDRRETVESRLCPVEDRLPRQLAETDHRWKVLLGRSPLDRVRVGGAR
jgi:hypothetical protein